LSADEVNIVSEDIVLSVENLATSFAAEAGRVRAVDDISFEVKKGKTLGIVGESGCGKSVTALSIMRLLPKPAARIDGGRVMFNGVDLVRLPADQLPAIRGSRISMIFQEPMTALNPVHKIGKQLGEVFRLHFPDMSSREVQNRSIAMLEKVGIPDPLQRLQEYPHQISGGMRQRVMIAMALGGNPDILIADEPTTALDVTIQAQILNLIKDLQNEIGMAVVFITHDLGVIAEICDDVLVMYAGKAAEKAPVEELFYYPKHPYTRGLLFSIPRLEHPRKQKLAVIPGMVPGLHELPVGCRFSNRCPERMPVCNTAPPDAMEMEDHHRVWCYLYSEKSEKSF
jgi:oligopeptide/dipeptide ABC transporter ATP-binding protein